MRRLILFAALLPLACINIDTDRHHYPCTPGSGASQCPGSWVCGLEGICHDPDAGAAYLCESTANCASGWHCGVSLDGGTATCHEAVPAAYACNSSADCEGWICSAADDTCHAADSGYRCNDDHDCVSPYRCGLGICVDVAEDGLDAGEPLAMLSGGFQTSPINHTQPALFEVSPWYALPQSGQQTADPAQDFAYVTGRSLEVVIDRPSGVAIGSTGQQAFAPAMSVPTSAAPVALGLLGPSVFWSDETSAYRFDIDAGTAELSGTLTDPGLGGVFVPTSYRANSLPVWQSMFAFSDLNYAYYQYPNDGGPPALQYQSTVADFPDATTIFDLIETPSGDVSTVLAATDNGLFFSLNSGAVPSWQAMMPSASYDGGQWVIANDQCGASTGVPLQVVRLYPGQSDDTNGDGQIDVIAQALLPDGGTVVAQFQGPPGCTPPPGNPQLKPPCAPCPFPGDEVVATLDQYDTSGSGRPGNIAATRCRHITDAGSFEQVYELIPPDPTRSDRTQCQWEYPEHDGLARIEMDTSVSQHSAPAFAGLVGANAETWFAANDAGFAFIQPLFLDQLPDSFVELQIGAMPMSIATVGSSTWSLEASGYTSGPLGSQGLNILGAVAGERRWGIVSVLGTTEIVDSRSLGQNQFPPTLALFDPTRQGEMPVLAAVASEPDGGSLLIASEFDAFLTGDVTAFAPGQDAGSPFASPIDLQVALAPQPQIPIISIAAVNPPRHGYAEAYLLTALEIVHAYAESPTRWSSEVLTPPADPTNWLSIWTDGDRARIGFASGVVFSLPTLVPLSAAPPNGASVSSYAQVCSTTFALAGATIYRLTPSTTGDLATWEDVMTEAGLTAMPWLDGGKLFWGSGALIAFSPYGQVYRIPIASGCP